MKSKLIITAVLYVLPSTMADSQAAFDMAKLEAALTAACPLDGFSVGSFTDKSTWRLDFNAAATQAQRDACNSAVASFDPAAAPNSPSTYVPTLAIFRRLTAAEYTALMQAANTRLTQGNGQFLQWLDLARASGRIDLSDPTTVSVKAALVSAGVLTQPRADLIFR